MVQINSLQTTKPLVTKPVNIPTDPKTFKKPKDTCVKTIDDSKQFLDVLIKKRKGYL